jgi:hypothetical protein
MHGKRGATIESGKGSAVDQIARVCRGQQSRPIYRPPSHRYSDDRPPSSGHSLASSMAGMGRL